MLIYSFKTVASLQGISSQTLEELTMRLGLPFRTGDWNPFQDSKALIDYFLYEKFQTDQGTFHELFCNERGLELIKALLKIGKDFSK